MNTKLILLLVALTGHAVLSRPDSYESYEDLALSSPSSSEESSGEIPLQEFQETYFPYDDGPPEAYFEKLKAKMYAQGFELAPGTLDQLKAEWANYIGKPLPEPTAEELAKIDDDLNKSELKRMNYLRSLHGAKPLKYNEKLAVYAQNYAEKISAAMESGEEFVHNPENKIYSVGENMAGEETRPRGFQYKGHSANFWYFGEIESYNRNGNHRAPRRHIPEAATGHFTQVVWKDTKEAGCGSACYKGANGPTCNVICNFYPAGNPQVKGNDAKTDQIFAKNVNMNINWPKVFQLKEQVINQSELLKNSFEAMSQKRGY